MVCRARLCKFRGFQVCVILYMGTYSSFMYWSVFSILVISWKEPWATQDRFGVAGASKDNLLGHSMFK